MNRRSFFKMLTGFVAGVYAAFAPNKADSSISASISHSTACSQTLNWINMGQFKDSSCTEMHCCYTHKNGRKMKCMVLLDDNNFSEDLITHARAIKKRAVYGGAWYPTPYHIEWKEGEEI